MCHAKRPPFAQWRRLEEPNDLTFVNRDLLVHIKKIVRFKNNDKFVTSR